MSKKEYLGDSVYMALDKDGFIVLTTENGYGPSNTILMEYSVVKMFEAVLEKWRNEAQFP